MLKQKPISRDKYPPMTSKMTFCDILLRMAKLREQSRMAKALRDFYKNTGYTIPASYGTRLVNLANDAIPEKDFSGHMATRMNLRDRLMSMIRPAYYKSPNYLLDRANRNNRLYKSCLEDKLIEPVTRQIFDDVHNVYVTENIGIRLTDKGYDITHVLGFIEEWLSKYPTQKLVVYTIIGTICSAGVLIPVGLWAFHLVINFIQHLP